MIRIYPQAIRPTTGLMVLFMILLGPDLVMGQENFPWPDGKKMAISLSFDDSRPSNLVHGIPLLNRYGVRATFYVHPHVVKEKLGEWRAAVAQGHEIGNHTLVHPCSGNFLWSRHKSLEEYTLADMKEELAEANRQIEELLGVSPKSFAYPCGQTYVGRGPGKKSYAPLVAELFTSGRGWLDEAPADPLYGDLTEVSGVKMDDMAFQELMPMIQYARENNLWLVLVGHDTQPEMTGQTTRLDFLDDLCEYIKSHDDIWVAPIGEVASYVEATRTNGRLLKHELPFVQADLQGTINLKASMGRGLGPKIEYMEDWKAFGWWMNKDTVVWNINVPQSQTYRIEMEWSVSDEDADKDVQVVVDGTVQTVTIEKTGGWEAFRRETVGTLQIGEGKHAFMVIPAESDLEGPLMDLRHIRLVPVPKTE